MAGEQWLLLLERAKKTAIIQDGKRKVHFLFEDGKEMVEEYNLETNVMIRRAWLERGKLSRNVGWIVEVGDPEPRKHEDSLSITGIRESANAPLVTRRITRTSLEWRIRNASHPKDVYSVTVDEDSAITVRTSNKKYFKKITVPDLERIGLKLEQERLSWTHQYNTLIITYKKPPLLIDVEKKILRMVMQLDVSKQGDVQCPMS